MNKTEYLNLRNMIISEATRLENATHVRIIFLGIVSLIFFCGVCTGLVLDKFATPGIEKILSSIGLAAGMIATITSFYLSFKSYSGLSKREDDSNMIIKAVEDCYLHGKSMEETLQLLEEISTIFPKPNPAQG